MLFRLLPRPTSIDPHLKRRAIPRGRPPSDVRFECGLVAQDQGCPGDKASVRQEHNVSTVAIIAPLQLGEGEVVWFECPQLDARSG